KRAENIRFVIKSNLLSLITGKLGLIIPTTPNLNLSNIKSLKFESDLYTVLSNITGLPSINVPVGIDKNGIPFGIQIIGNAFDEANLFAICNSLQKMCGLIITSW
ncbi:MAG: amidase family protein, partial [Candidatus Hodgkinia cicadicola]